ncbi:U-box domain-containing protein 4 [Hordeum vulgare]|nr:U-box domain-containing protein 4 [Hordeum vulgare]
MENKAKEVVSPMEQDKGNHMVPHTSIQVAPTDDDVVPEEPPNGKRRNYDHFHEEGGPIHLCKEIMASKLEAIPMPLDFRKNFPTITTEFKLKMNT